MININFDNPYLLLVLIPLLAITIVSFIIAIGRENRTIKNIISFAIHIVICLLVSFALAKTTFELVVTKTEVYVLADVSYSTRNNLDLIDDYISDLEENTPRNSKLGVICFGKDYELLVPLGEELISVKEANVNNSETDIANAMEYANSLFNENVVKRIVIISDGKETNQNNIASLVETLALDDVYIDAIYVDNNIKDEEKEVQITEVEHVTSTYINNPEEVYVYLESNIDTRAMVTLYCNGEVFDQEAITLTKGSMTVSLNLKTDEASTYNYKVVVEPDSDTTAANNTYLFEQEVFSEINVLVLCNTSEEKVAADQMYAGLAKIDYYCKASSKGFSNVPYTVEELAKYDEFVLINTDVRDCPNASQFVSSLDILVSEFGKSLTTIGNTYIQNNYDDETLMALNDILPVKYGNDDQETKLVTLVMDYSRSMEQIYKLHIARQTAYTILDNLDDNVMVLVIGFFGEVVTVYDPAPASDRELIKEKIEKQQAYQGTFMGSALTYAHSFINSLNYKKNEVLLISDGLPYGEQAGLTKEIVSKMAKEGIVLSTINTVSNEGETLMQDLATIGKGYYYSINDLDDVESLVLDEVLNSLKEMVLENTEMPVSILLENDTLVKGIDTLPSIYGIYNNVEKSSANVVLSATYTDAINNIDHEIPLYSYWSYGNGKVSSFASTIEGVWIKEWNTSDTKEVIQNFVMTSIPSEKLDSAFIISSEAKGTVTDIIVKAPSVNKGSVLSIKVTNPDNSVTDTVLTFDTENYVGTVKTDQIGEYKVELTYTLGELTYNSDYTFYVSYLPEYDAFTIYEASNLYYMVTTNGTISEDGVLVLENDSEDVLKYIYDLTPTLMILSVVLFVVDVIVRKLRLQDIKSLFKKYKKEEKIIKEEK